MYIFKTLHHFNFPILPFLGIFGSLHQEIPVMVAVHTYFAVWWQVALMTAVHVLLCKMHFQKKRENILTNLWLCADRMPLQV